jgi:hypothetical protein
MRYVFLAAHEDTFEVKRMCQALGVTRSGYYAWKQHPRSAREQANQELMGRIKVEFEHSRKTYGSPRIQAALERQGVGCSHAWKAAQTFSGDYPTSTGSHASPQPAQPGLHGGRS